MLLVVFSCLKHIMNKHSFVKHGFNKHSFLNRGTGLSWPPQNLTFRSPNMFDSSKEVDSHPVPRRNEERRRDLPQGRPHHQARRHAEDRRLQYNAELIDTELLAKVKVSPGQDFDLG